MEDSDVEAAEKEPLVTHQAGDSSSKSPHEDTPENPTVTRNPSTPNPKDDKGRNLAPPRKHRKQKKDSNEGNEKGSEKRALERTASSNDCEIKLEGKGDDEKGDDEAGTAKGDEETASLLCPGFFGVKNYLHHFYEKTEVKNLHMYEDTPRGIGDPREAIFMVKRQDGLCSSSIFRLSLMLGGIILLMGTTALIVATCASRKATLVGKVGGIAVVDRVAAAHNAEVDALLLVALIALTLGATVVAAALVSRAFCRRPEYEDGFREGVLAGYDSIYEHPPFLHPSQKKVPVTENLTQIQPWISASHHNLH